MTGLFGAIQAQLDQLSPRDRRLLGGLVAFVGLVVVLLVALSLRGALRDKASRVVTQKDTLEAIQDLQGEHAVAAARIEAAEARLREYGDQPLSAYLERSAAAVGLSDELAVSRQQTEVVGGVAQTRYKVDLNRVPYDLALNFIYDIETSGYPLTVESARFRSVTTKDEKQLSVTLEMLAYSLQEGTP